MATLTAEFHEISQVDETSAWRLPKSIPELDGIRGLAILMVLICHSSSWVTTEWLRTFLHHGRIGVDLFFVLSGFLITGILLDTRHAPNRTRNFYIRRGLRIWPLYFTFLMAAGLLFRRMLPQSPQLWLYALFVQNFFYFLGRGPFLDPTWSLAVEEQFYLVWPWVAFRVRRETVLKICCVVLFVSPLIRFVANALFHSEEIISVNTLCRLDGMAMGGALAAWIRQPNFSLNRLRTFAWRILPIGCLGSLVSLALEKEYAFARAMSYSMLAAVFGGMVAMAIVQNGEKQPYPRFFRQRWMTYLGKVSFALYLFNYPIYVIVHGNAGHRLIVASKLGESMSEWTMFLLANILLLAATWVSWKILESPMLKLKSRLAPR